MMRISLAAEGPTEQTFAVKVLAPHLAGFNVLLPKPILTALGKKKGHVHRGGMRAYEPFKNDVIRRLKEDQHPDVRFTTMIDLYGLPKDFPGYDEARTTRDCYRRVEKLEADLKKDIGDPRFIPYIQLHEFEALLLSRPQAFDIFFPDRSREIERLVLLCKENDNPEKINDDENNAPSKRIGKEIPEYLGAKPTAGPIIAAEIGLRLMRDKCPHFHQWLTELERLGGC